MKVIVVKGKKLSYKVHIFIVTFKISLDTGNVELQMTTISMEGFNMKISENARFDALVTFFLDKFFNILFVWKCASTKNDLHFLT